jgi:tripartite-type tricarboxylate transporter receptor subunit TctC
MALLGGEVQLMFNNVQTVLQNVKAGQMIPLAIAEPSRMPVLPDIPTVAETVPGFQMAPWIGVITPVKTPKEIVARLSQTTLAVMRDPDVVKTLTEQQVTPYVLEPDQFADLIRKDLERWAHVIKTAGIKGEP